MHLMQAFIKDVLGVSVAMEPNFTDFSCQVKLWFPSCAKRNSSGAGFRLLLLLPADLTDERICLQFNFGVEALPRDQDPGLQTPCLSICPTAAARATLRSQAPTDQCPQVHPQGSLHSYCI